MFSCHYRVVMILESNTSCLACMMASCSRPAKEAEGESTTVPNWLKLPTDVTANILHRLGTIEIVTSACQVCPLWWNICKDPLMWRNIDMSNLRTSSYDLVKICGYAVERSCGLLGDIDIECFCTDDLLNYIADCSSHLRRIRLAKCRGISHKGFSEVAKKLPLLEELDISFSNLSKDSLEVIGRCCPLLKSLKFSRMFCEYIKCDDDAFAIAKTMRKLRHLMIFGNLLTNVGLLAILVGCPLLESLDLRGCFHLDLSGSLGKRCHDQIIDLWVPTDYVDDSCVDYDESYLVSLLTEDEEYDFDYLLLIHNFLPA